MYAKTYQLSSILVYIKIHEDYSACSKKLAINSRSRLIDSEIIWRFGKRRNEGKRGRKRKQQFGKK